ncbi:hypothetical protein GCM10010271_03110 [Streptomyces kurssanovii]|nr:hypothetical protein GCM10010271_03110 [Streptomyces kurssanovii]
MPIRRHNERCRRAGTERMLGLGVHDCAQARVNVYLDGVLEQGQVLTVEPGLYLQPDDGTLPDIGAGSACASRTTSSSRPRGRG